MIILISGPIAVGKTTLAQGMSRHYNCVLFNTREILEKRLEHIPHFERNNLQLEGEVLDKATKGQWVSEELNKFYSTQPGLHCVIVDAIRIKEQIDWIRARNKVQVVHIHLTASKPILEGRYKERVINKTESKDYYEELKKNKTESLVEHLSMWANFVINTDDLSSDQVLSTVKGYLSKHYSSLVRM